METQLLSWLQKYDLEMGDKQVDLDDYNVKYEEELNKCEELEVCLILKIDMIPIYIRLNTE